MPFRDPALYFRHILGNIESISAFLEGRGFAEYQADLKTKRAVEREIGNLTEAAFRLGDEAEMLCPGIDWRGIRGMGNFLRHNYEGVSDTVIWNVIVYELPPLKEAIQKALVEFKSTLQNPSA